MNLKIAFILLTIAFGQFRLVIEKIHLAGSAMLEQADHGVGGGRMMSMPILSEGRPRPALLEQMSQRQQTHSANGLVQKRPAIVCKGKVNVHVRFAIHSM